MAQASRARGCAHEGYRSGARAPVVTIRALSRRTAFLVLACLALGAAPAHAAGRCGDPAGRPWCDTGKSPDERAQLLLAALTQAEKIDLLAGDELTGVAGGEHKHTGTQNGVPRLGVPTIYYSDGPVGPRQGPVTAMPIPMANAATFNPAANALYGRTVAEEVRAKGNDVVFAPTINVMRTPLNGRTFEGFGEDPFLISRTAVAWIRAAQKTGVLVNVKHFAMNNQEGASSLADQSRPGQLVGPPPDPGKGDRMKVNVQVDERTMRETELRGFEAAVKQAHVASIMCSYNKVNGTYACQNGQLLRDIPAGWGFKGYVLADYNANHDTAASLKSGLDFEPWPGFIYGAVPVNAALLAGQASMADVDRHVLRMLRTWFAYGVFDRPAFVDDTASIPQASHRARAQRIEEQAITLLVNRRRTLPLNAHKLRSIAVIGAGADTFITGGGSGNVTPFRYVSPLQAIQARVPNVVHDDGSDPARAAAVARAADVAVVFTPDYQTEGVDRRCLTLECPPAFHDQDALIESVAAANKRTIVVLETGGPVLTPWRGKVAGLLEAWYPGQEGGTAIARVLFGNVDPGGRLPATFPRSEADLPTAGDPMKYPGVGDEEQYKEGVFVGYRWYDAHKLKVAYPFGYGLSYTKWRLGKPRLHGRTVRVRVRNAGRRRGSTVVQLYVKLPSSQAVPQPPRQLRGYRKVALRRHRAKTLRFHLSRRDLAYWNTAAHGWRIKRGQYRVFVGFSSRHLRAAGTIRRR
jgi:beta-glucosidase